MRHERVTQPVTGDRHIALPFSVLGVGLGEACGDGEIGLKGFHSPGQVSLLLQHVANIGINHPQLSQPLGVIRVRLDEPLHNVPLPFVVAEGSGKIALRDLHHANP